MSNSTWLIFIYSVVKIRNHWQEMRRWANFSKLREEVNRYNQFQGLLGNTKIICVYKLQMCIFCNTEFPLLGHCPTQILMGKHKDYRMELNMTSLPSVVGIKHN